MKKFLKLFLIISLSIIIISGCGKKDEVGISNNKDKIKVVVTFNPLREFVDYIGKDKVDVNVIIPEGTEPHDFEPKAKDIMKLNEGDLFIYNGFGMEGWVDKTLKSIENNKMLIVDSSKGCEPINIEEDNHDHGNSHGNSNDPHIWLGLTTAKRQAFNIKEALIKLDESNKEFYEENYKEFEKEIDNLLNSYKNKFEQLDNKSFVTGHSAFSYFCRDFGLEQRSVEGVFAEGEPSSKKLKELVDYCKSKNIKTIFLEENVSPKVSETLAKEVGAEVKVIDTIEYKKEDKKYLEIMKENIDKVYNSLK
ncbi:metal ABC transporter substrate-binding protein [Clostridium cochlearium]|uniref:High-affinity Zinc uptake system protein znuA n=1 Tax=Clostridium cochlearium TaxID=1494 RepID=A0A1G9FS32_CLOCO|nr:metal ABC transporter substrate-binding protein [Clostridium cochlearium]MBV1818881.1 metal ABC transporter substrate-binding protein [Bacteroidales bacterium MSK.15.36]MBE6065843.1 ABC transporter substrate-binding protein [Clostridium cochlearium]MBU5268651.1 metal ABC transporter substrate-binding protein [Clostridium cochlearium]MCG4571652.1 metal ABC transporter substrate-binding protein [Clostridium cochlearium]MCR1970945.1 metal ABC transporter substrate-binding protein [Clostridium 